MLDVTHIVALVLNIVVGLVLLVVLVMSPVDQSVVVQEYLDAQGVVK